MSSTVYCTLPDEEKFRDIVFNSVNITRILPDESEYGMLLIVKHNMFGYRPAYVDKSQMIIDFRSNSTLWNVELDEVWLINYDTDLGI